MYLNIVQVCGRLTKSPELKNTAAGIVVLQASVATNRSWKDRQGNKQEEVEYHNIVAFGKVAEMVAKYFEKGDEIYVMGHLKTDIWKDQNGTNHYRTNVMVEKVSFGQKAKNNQTGGYGGQTVRQEAQPDVEPGEEDEEEIRVENIPF